MIRAISYACIILIQCNFALTDEDIKPNYVAVGRKMLDRTWKTVSSPFSQKTIKRERAFTKNYLREIKAVDKVDWRFAKREGGNILHGARHLANSAAGAAQKNVLTPVLHGAGSTVKSVSHWVQEKTPVVAHKLSTKATEFADAVQDAGEATVHRALQARHIMKTQVKPALKAAAIRSAGAVAATSVKVVKTIGTSAASIADSSLETAQKVAEHSRLLQGVQIPNVLRTQFPAAATMNAAVTNPLKIARNQVVLSHKLAGKAVNQVADTVVEIAPSFKGTAEKLRHSKYPVAIAVKEAVMAEARTAVEVEGIVQDTKKTALRALANHPRMFPRLASAASKAEGSRFPVQKLAEQTVISDLIGMTKVFQQTAKALTALVS